MKLVYVTREDVYGYKPGDKDYERYTLSSRYNPKKAALAEQYFELLKQHSTPASQDEELKPGALPEHKLMDFCEWLALLVDEQNKVLAGATVKWNARHQFIDGKHLPKDKSTTPDYNIGYVHKVVSAPNTGKFMPGLELQEQMLREFKERKGEFKNVEVLVGYVVPQNALTLHEAAKNTGLDTVVRDDLTKETPNGKSFFVATTRSSLVPSDYKEHVLSEDTIRDLAHDELVKFKRAHPKPRTRGQHSSAERGIG